MTLRKMTLLVVGLTFLGLIVVTTVTLEVTLIRHFNDVEQQSVRQNVQRAQAALESDFDYLDLVVKDLVRLEEGADLNARFSPEIFTDHQINLVALAAGGKMVSGQAFDLASGAERGLPAGLEERLAGLERRVSGEPVRGLLSLPEGVVLVSGLPAGDTSKAGLVVVGRWLNNKELQRLATMMRLSLTLYRQNAADLPADFLAARSSLTETGQVYTTNLDESTAAGYYLLNDLDGQPVYILRVDQPRTVYLNGRFLMTYLAIALILAGLCFGFMTLMMVERLVLSRVTGLSREVERIRASGQGRVTVTSNDELSRLSQGINRMLDSLERMDADLRQRVADQGALNEASRLFLAHPVSNSILQSACELAVDKFGLQAAWIGLVAANEARVTPAASSAGPQDQALPVQVSWQQPPEELHPAAAVIRTGEAVIRAPLDPQLAAWQPFERAYQAVAALPLALDGSIRAVLCLYSQQVEFFDGEKTQLLQSLANLAGIALQNAQLFEQVLAGRQRLQALSRRLVEVQEEERRAIALELHDEIGQILTGLKLLLDNGAALPPEKQAGQLQQAQEVVNELIQRVRQLSLDLRPAMLDDLGLLPALLWLFDRYTSQTRVQVICQHSRIEGERFPPEFETAAYRVVQEGLTNIARYAGSNQAAVRLWNDGSILGIQIQDEGCGFDPEAVLSSGNSRGLVGMRERAYSLGGRLVIDSTPSQGACLTVELPLAGHLERRRNARSDSAGG